MFGVITRREQMEDAVNVMKDVHPDLKLSVRFLCSFILDMSDLELRSRVVHYISEIFAVPLIYPSHISYENQK